MRKIEEHNRICPHCKKIITLNLAVETTVLSGIKENKQSSDSHSLPKATIGVSSSTPEQVSKRLNNKLISLGDEDGS